MQPNNRIQPKRERFKVCSLAVQYGMTEVGLAGSLGKSLAFARNLLLVHRETYPTFWKWSQNNIDHAMLAGWLQTVFGWRIHIVNESNPRSLANFPMQANGAEMLRLACCLATENGIDVCCPVHDAILVEGPSEAVFPDRVTPPSITEGYKNAPRSGEAKMSDYIMKGVWNGFEPPPLPKR